MTKEPSYLELKDMIYNEIHDEKIAQELTDRLKKDRPQGEMKLPKKGEFSEKRVNTLDNMKNFCYKSDDEYLNK